MMKRIKMDFLTIFTFKHLSDNFVFKISQKSTQDPSRNTANLYNDIRHLFLIVLLIFLTKLSAVITTFWVILFFGFFFTHI